MKNANAQPAGLKSGELARRAGINPETLRYYEREGLLEAPPRTGAGYRLYNEEDVRRVKFIRRAQALGFTLKEIRELLALRLDATRSAAEVKHLTEAKIRDIDQKIASLTAMKTVLTELADACTGEGSAETCCILNTIEDT